MSEPLKDTIEAMLTRNKVPSIGGRWPNFAKEEDATPIDRVFLESWRYRADDPIWSKILAAINLEYGRIVMYGLRANRLAEAMCCGDGFFERKQSQRQELLNLADMAEGLANFLRGARRLLPANRRKHGYWQPDEFLREYRQSIEASVGPAIFDRNVAALDITNFAEPFAEGSNGVRGIGSGSET
jgi:hypothetical protein